MSTTTKILDATGDDAATINGWSDRYPATIIKRTAKTITIQRDRTSNLSSRESIDSGQSFAQGRGDLTIFERDYDAGMETYTLRKNGRWIRRGSSMNGPSLTLGHRSYYRDPHF
jgi:hypothetical protein